LQETKMVARDKPIATIIRVDVFLSSILQFLL
jgi:hypothetical protein